MRTVKIKHTADGPATLAHPNARLNGKPPAAIVQAIHNVPDAETDAALLLAFEATTDATWIGQPNGARLEFDRAELQPGAIIRK
jgi:hypothetical protein